MSLHQALLYHFQSAPWIMIMICALSDNYQGDILEGLKKGDSEVLKNLCCKRKCGFTINPSSRLPALACQSAVWRGRDDASPSSAHLSLLLISPPIKTLCFIRKQLPSLKFISPGREQCSLCLCPQLDSTPRGCELIKKFGGTISLTRWRASELMVCLIFNGLHYD